MNVQEHLLHVPIVMKQPTDIKMVTHVHVKPDFMIMELITNVPNVVIFVMNV